MSLNILVFIPTFNAANCLPKLLTSLKNQTIKVETNIIDSSSDDETLDIVKSYGNDFTVIKREDFNHATTRNSAKKYEADFYLFMTQDALPADDKLVENLIKPFVDPDVVVSYARQIPHEDADVLEKFARETNYPPTSLVKSKTSFPSLGIKTFFASNTCAMYRASYFRTVNGFREGLIMNEDMEYAARAILNGKKVAYCAEAKVWHSHRYGLKALFRRYFDIGIFFKTNPWIREEVEKYSSTESTGIKQAKAELGYLWRKAPLALPRSLLFSITKYTAYKLGHNYDKLPKRVVRACSLHQNFHA